MKEGEIDNEIKNLLLDKESILLSASQERVVPGGSINTPNAIYITNIRVIFKDPRWLGMKAEIIDVNYNDISNTRLNRGIFSTEIYLKARYHSDEIKLPAVSKEVASQVHGMIQKGIRGDLPGQNIATTNANIEVSSKKDKPEDNSNYMEKLEKLIDWRQKSMITEKEFQELKSQILDSISNKKQQQQTLNNRQQLTNNNSTQSMNTIDEDNDDNNKKTLDLLTYENSRIGIKIQYPVDWKLYEKEYYPDHPDEQWSQVVGFSLPREINTHSKLEIVAIYVKPLATQNTTLDAYANKQINHLRKKSSVHESTTTTLAGNHAHKVVYTDKKGYDVIEIWTIKSDSVYSIQYAAKPEDYSSYLPIFLKMLDSFEIKK